VAENSGGMVFGLLTNGTGYKNDFFHLHDSATNFSCHYARRNGDYPVAHDHDDGSQEFPKWCNRSNITITHGSKGYNGPINPLWNIVQLGIGAPFHNIYIVRPR